MDAQRAIGLIRQQAETGKIPGLNSSQIGFMGFSAGGHLTGHISTAWETRTYPRVDSADDVSCRPDFSLMIYPWMTVQDDLKTLTLNVTNTTPATFLTQAEDDSTAHVECSLFYWLALKQQAAPPSELHLYPRGGHGYGRCTVNPVPWHEVCGWPDRAQLFLKTLGVAPPRPA